jgi:hypothetical protein
LSTFIYIIQGIIYKFSFEILFNLQCGLGIEETIVESFNVLMKHDSGEKYLGFGVRILFD